MPKIILPKALPTLCHKSLLKKTLKTPEKITTTFLRLCASGLEAKYPAPQCPKILIREKLDGVSRQQREREAFLQRRILMQLKRRKLIEEHRLGNKIIYNLTIRGETQLLKERIREINKISENSKRKCIIIFDIPETQRTARDLFRRFLKECSFLKLQQSVWCAHEGVLPHLCNFLARLEINKWVKILKVEEVIG